LRRIHSYRLLAIALAICLRGGSSAAAADISAVATTGAIEGTVTYKADAKNPWRYARYYVKSAKGGELSEAVVAIRGKALEKSKTASSMTVKIDQKDFQFEPELVAIRVGDSVTFTNSDTATHNVRASGEVGDFNLTMPAGGEGHTIKFEKAGGVRRPVEIGCVFHSNMRAWVFVFDHPFFAVTKPDGKFRLADVPTGEYELELVHAAGGLKTKKMVTVKAGETAKVDFELSPADVR
jgi:plastocyanin